MAKQSVQAKMESILDTPSEHIERPKPLPQGSYITVVQGNPRFDKSSEQQTEFVEFTLKILQTEDDVDEDDLDKFLTNGDGSKKPLNEVTTRHTFYLTDRALYRLKDFTRHCGIDSNRGTPRQWIAELPGCQVGIHVKHKPFTSGEGVSANIDRSFPV
jgi:hypothetical protein